MTKEGIHRLFIDKLYQEWGTLTAAAKNSISTATDEAHRSESKYDTFSLESSYLARGQAKRVEELKFALERLQAFQFKPLTDTPSVQLGTLVRMETADGKKRTLFFGPAAGGAQIIADGEEIVIITALAPLGRVLLGKRAGETFDFKIGTALQTFKVVSVE